MALRSFYAGISHGVRAAATTFAKGAPGAVPDILGECIYRNERAGELEGLKHKPYHGTCWTEVAEQVTELGHLAISGKEFYVSGHLEEVICYAPKGGTGVILQVATEQCPALNPTFQTAFFPNAPSGNPKFPTPPIYVLEARRINPAYVEWHRKQSFAGVYKRATDAIDAGKAAFRKIIDDSKV